jgi:hypothetical protein
MRHGVPQPPPIPADGATDIRSIRSSRRSSIRGSTKGSIRADTGKGSIGPGTTREVVEKKVSRGSSTSLDIGNSNADVGGSDLRGPAGFDCVPQSSTSPDDPLNWSWRKKHTVLLALIPGCLLSDWTLTWGTTVFQLQAPEWFVYIPVYSRV